METTYSPTSVPRIADDLEILARDEPTASTEPARVKPSLRGVLHQVGFVLSLLTGAALIASATHATGRLAATIYAASLSGLLGTSTLYHRVNWPPATRLWLGRLDMGMIYVLIAGSLTPFVLLGLVGEPIATYLWIAWGTAFGAATLTMIWSEMPKALGAMIYIAAGWLGVLTFPELLQNLGWAGCSLVAFGGVLYSIGAVIYGCQRPDPYPEVFGYHEVFHAFVLAGAAAHYVAIAAFLPL